MNPASTGKVLHESDAFSFFYDEIDSTLRGKLAVFKVENSLASEHSVRVPEDRFLCTKTLPDDAVKMSTDLFRLSCCQPFSSAEMRTISKSLLRKEATAMAQAVVDELQRRLQSVTDHEGRCPYTSCEVTWKSVDLFSTPPLSSIIFSIYCQSTLYAKFTQWV